MSGFDYKVHKRDSKSGRIISANPYRMICEQVEGGGSTVRIERPTGSGIWYNADGTLNEKLSQEGLKKQAAEAAAEEARQAELNKSPEQKKQDDIKRAAALLAEHAPELLAIKQEQEAKQKEADLKKAGGK